MTLLEFNHLKVWWNRSQLCPHYWCVFCVFIFFRPTVTLYMGLIVRCWVGVGNVELLWFMFFFKFQKALRKGCTHQLTMWLYLMVTTFCLH